jgi:hypothetical protein
MEEMPYDELACWASYFHKRPLGWQEDLRTSYVMRSFGCDLKPEQIFDSLATLKREAARKQQPVATSLLKSSFLQKLLAAEGGDKIPLEIPSP